MESNVRKDIAKVPITAGKCDSAACQAEDDEGKLECKIYEKARHYICTKLPDYQVYLFIKDGKPGNSYVCEECVDIPSDMKENFNMLTKSKRDAVVESLKNDLALRKKELADAIHDQKKVKVNNFRAIMMATKNEEFSEEA